MQTEIILAGLLIKFEEKSKKATKIFQKKRLQIFDFLVKFMQKFFLIFSKKKKRCNI